MVLRFQRNTFQVVLISDGKLTFALFNYEALQWPSYLNGPYALVSMRTQRLCILFL